MRVNRWDICVPGMEPFRCRDEFIVSTCVHKNSTREDVLEALLQDVNCCEREEDFDFNSARTAVHHWFCIENGGKLVMDVLEQLDYDGSNPDWAENCCCLFLYITAE